MLSQDKIDTIITILGLLTIYATIYATMNYIDYKRDSLRINKNKEKQKIKYIEMEKDLPWLNQLAQDESIPVATPIPDRNIKPVKYESLKD